MYEYITTELPQVLKQFPELKSEKVGISYIIVLFRGMDKDHGHG